MNHKPLVSVIIPCKNPGRMFELCLRSCDDQTYDNVEILIVDNGSTDGSVGFANRFASMSRHPAKVLHCPDPGACAARMHGLRASQGDFIQWLDADDLLERTKLDRQMRQMTADDKIDITYCDWIWKIRRDGIIHDRVVPERQRDDMLLELLKNEWLPPHAYLVSRRWASRLEAVGVFNPNTPSNQDREYFTMAAIYGAQFQYTPGTFVVYNWWSDSQMTSTVSRLVRAEATKNIFLSFKDHAAAQPVGRITHDHWLFLHQPWNFFVISDQSLKAAESDDRIRRYTEKHQLSMLQECILKEAAQHAEGRTIEGISENVRSREGRLSQRHADVLTAALDLINRHHLVPLPSVESEVPAECLV